MAENFNVVFPRKLLKKLILLYKDSPCLWDRHSLGYKLKQKRHAAITKLTELVQEYDPSATRVHILRKIESLRACVRREFRKVQESKRNASSEDEVYTPHLWYYDMLSFIFQDEEFKGKELDSPETTANSDGEEAEYIEDDEQSFESPVENYNMYNVAGNSIEVTENSSSACSASKRYSYDEETNKSKRHCTEIEDEYDAIGINVAAKLRNLPPNMRILAEKLINDVMFQAQTNVLTNATVIVTPDPFK